LKGIRNELFKDINDIFEELEYYVKIWNDLRRLYSDINGGKALQGYVACHLCPPKPS
jgi:hypothetical protein